MKRLFFAFFLLLFSVQLHAQYRVDDIPNPKSQGQDYFVSNPDGLLSSETVDRLNAQSVALEAENGVEMVVVMVNTFEGGSDFDFALSLFNHWGIGKKGSDNGILLFVAKEERAYRFISGYGIESIIPDVAFKRIADRFLLPNFKAGNYDQGLVEASAFIQELIRSPEVQQELMRMLPEEVPFWSLQNVYFKNSIVVLLAFVLGYFWVGVVGRSNRGALRKKSSYFHPVVSGLGCMFLLMFLSVFIFIFVFNNLERVYQLSNMPYFVGILGSITLAMKYNQERSRIQDSYLDEEHIQKALNRFSAFTFIPMLFSPLAYFDFFGIKSRIRKNKDRFTPPTDSSSWIRINRDEEKDKISTYLSKGQLKEEKIGSRRYEIWYNTETKEVQRTVWDENSLYEECPECHFMTFETDLEKVILAATYSAGGISEEYSKCRNCKHRVSHGEYNTEKLRESSSSSSSSGGGSSGGGGGGSFGGGSSGGGGAGGRW